MSEAATRREALTRARRLAAGAFLRAQPFDPSTGSGSPRALSRGDSRTLTQGKEAGAERRPKPPLTELITTFEFEEVARRVLPPAAYSAIAGSDRSAFDRMTLRPRLGIPVLDLDLSVDLFGEKHFTPIVVGPVADQRRYHADGELATAAGASAGRAALIVSNRSSAPISEIAAKTRTPLWYSVYADAGAAAAQNVQQALAAGCKVLCITLPTPQNGAGKIDWTAVDQIRRGVTVPLVIKGVMTPQDARAALDRGARGIVVSDHGVAAAGKPAPIEMVPAIVDTVTDKATVLVDGGFRRGTDMLKALILGARGVLVARPMMWGLAAYGAEGVQSVIELLQSDLARHLGAVGASNITALTRNHIRIHKK
jgi:4-hydroxymandelate oxidase